MPNMMDSTHYCCGFRVKLGKLTTIEPVSVPTNSILSQAITHGSDSIVASASTFSALILVEVDYNMQSIYSRLKKQLAPM